MTPPPRARRGRGAERIAIITDIHGNLPALQAVLEEIERRKLGPVACCGDIVGYGPWPNETVELLQRHGIPCIQGNVDADVLEFAQTRRRLKRHRHPDKYRSLQFTSEVLTEASRRFLQELPPRRELDVAGHRVLLVHGSPEGVRDAVHPDVAVEVLARWHEETGADVIVCGHTHLPFVKAVGGSLFVNAGTAGRPSDGDPRVSFAVLTLGSRPTAEIVRVAYDAEPVVRAVAERRLPLSFHAMYRTGVNPWLAPPEDPSAAPPPDDDHLRAILGWQGDMDRALEAALQGDPEGIHDIRVATRRLRAGLMLLEERAGMRGALRRIRRARKLCAVLGKALSAPRSHQVHLGILQGIQDGCRGEASRVYMESVVVARGAALQESLARAAEAIRAFPADRLRRTVHQAVLRSAVALGPVPSAPATALLPVVKEAAARALASRSKEDLHQLRIDLKKLRYRLEASSHAKTPLHACAKHAQDVLGDAHDRDELILGFEEEVGRLRAAKARIMLRECRRSLAALRRERERILEGLDLGPILEASAAVADEGTAA